MNESHINLCAEEFFSDIQDKLIISPYAQEDMESHSHHFFELAYITGGSATHMIGDAVQELCEGDYFIVDFGVVHSYTNSKNLTLINCLFLPEIIDATMSSCHCFDDLLHSCLIRYYTPAAQRFPVNSVFHDHSGSVLALLAEMQAEYEKKAPAYPEMMRCQLIGILVHMMRYVIHSDSKHPKSSVIIKAIKYIDEGYHEQISLGSFCHDNHFSVQYISRKFRQETGSTFTSYLQRKRIENSCKLLIGTDISVSDIAGIVGYRDSKFFTKLFKQIVSFTPQQYRKHFS